MRTWSKNGAVVAVLCGGLLWSISSREALADVKDYEFQLVQSEMKKGDGAIVAVRLVNKKSGKPVPDAVIFAKRIDMAPDAMQEMTAPLEQLPSTAPGVYRFKTDLMMQAFGFGRRRAGSHLSGLCAHCSACYFAGGLVGTAILGQIFDRIGWAACVGGIALSLGVAAVLALCLKTTHDN